MDKTEILGLKDGKTAIKTKLLNKNKNHLKSGGKLAAGIGAGAGLFALYSFVAENGTTPDGPEVISENPIIYDSAPTATSVNDDMSFTEAFGAARIELGPGGVFNWNGNIYNTYFKEEWNELGTEGQSDYWASLEGNGGNYNESEDEDVIVYVEAPVAANVNDGMTFNEAFAAARQEVGEGGLFEWNGNVYNTYYKAEWDSLGPEGQDEYMASVDFNLNPEPDELIASNEMYEDPGVVLIPTDEGYMYPENVSNESGDALPIESNVSEPHVLEADMDGDGIIDSIVIDEDNDGFADAIIADTNHDGLPDSILLDTDLDGAIDAIVIDDDGVIDGTEEVIDIGEDLIIPMEEEIEVLDPADDINSNDDLDNLIANDKDDDVLNEDLPDIDDNADISDLV